jgi:hypothetical protein
MHPVAYGFAPTHRLFDNRLGTSAWSERHVETQAFAVLMLMITSTFVNC